MKRIVVCRIKFINTQCNITFIVSELLKDFPSAYERFTYTNTNSKGVKNQKLRTIMLKQQDFINIRNLEKSIQHYVEVTYYP